MCINYRNSEIGVSTKLYQIRCDRSCWFKFLLNGAVGCTSMIFYWFLLVSITALGMQASAIRTNFRYCYTYYDRSGKMIASNLPPVCMKGRGLTLHGVQVGSSLPMRVRGSVPICVCNNKDLLHMINNISVSEGVSPHLIRAIIQTESGFRIRAKSRSGALGLMQLMPDTAKRFGVLDSFNPHQNITGGVKYIKWLINNFKGDIYKTLAAYNAGEAAVTRHKGIPPFPETRNYVPMVLRRYYQYMANSSSNATGLLGLYNGSSRRVVTHIKDSESTPNIRDNSVVHEDCDLHKSSACIYRWANTSGRLQITDLPPPRDGS